MSSFICFKNNSRITNINWSGANLCVSLSCMLNALSCHSVSITEFCFLFLLQFCLVCYSWAWQIVLNLWQSFDNLRVSLLLHVACLVLSASLSREFCFQFLLQFCLLCYSWEDIAQILYSTDTVPIFPVLNNLSEKVYYSSISPLLICHQSTAIFKKYLLGAIFILCEKNKIQRFLAETRIMLGDRAKGDIFYCFCNPKK